MLEAVASISQPVTWLLITESWCGDAANVVPVFGKLATINKLVDLRIVLRDEHLELMDLFLTRGARSIPKLIALDYDCNVQYTWGPRPSTAQSLYDSWRNSENREPYKEFHITLQKWYNENKGLEFQEELRELIP